MNRPPCKVYNVLALLVILTLLVTLVLANAPRALAADVLIDTFSYASTSASYTIPQNPTFPITVTAASGTGVSEVIGGQRDLCLVVTGGNSGSSAQFRTDENNDYMDMALQTSVKARPFIQWDGGSNTDCTLDATGLRSGGVGVDLTGGGTNAGIQVRVVGSDGLPVTMTVRIYTDASNYARHTVRFQGNVQSPTQAVDIFLPFEEFTDVSGTLTITNVGAVELEIDASTEESAGADITIKIFKATTVYEYGDLPSYYGNDTLNARHIVLLTMRLGASLDAEGSHHASTLANGDDTSDFDDEDGVVRRNRNGSIPSGDPNWQAGVAGDDGKVRIAAKGCSETAACYFVGWIDWNRDGDFDDSLEKVVERVGLTSDYEDNYGFEIPIGTGFTDVRYYARFRICPAIWDEGAGWLSGACNTPTATGIHNGEIEDYAWDWGHPSAVKLTSFTATGQAGHVLLSWETATEIDNLGFNLYRRQAGTLGYAPLNAALIPSRSPGQGEGAAYTFLDVQVMPGTTYEYLLEDVDLNGTRTSHGPVAARTPYTVFLPLLAP